MRPALLEHVPSHIHVEQQPDPYEGRYQGRPSIADEGQWDTDDGGKVDDHKDIDRKLNENNRRDAERDDGAEGLRGALGYFQAPVNKGDEEQKEDDRSDKPPFLRA